MARAARPGKSGQDWNHLAELAARAGDFATARNYFERVVAANKRSGDARYNLALVLERMGERDEAAAQLTMALKNRPDLEAAALRLSGLLSAGPLGDVAGLEPFGLKAAMRFEGVDHQPLAETAIAHLAAHGALRDALALGRELGWQDAARSLLARRTGPALKDDLVLTALGAGFNTDPDVEKLLTALRRAILSELDDERFADKSVQNFAVALVRQCQINEFVFCLDAGEVATLESIGGSLDRRALMSGDAAACRSLLKLALYRSLENILESDAAGPAVDPTDPAAIKPRALAALCRERMAEVQCERRIAASLTRLGEIADPTSLRVAAQYEESPYPRWTSLAMPPPGVAVRALARTLGPETVTFAQGPFDVLVAGAGTGRHAILTAVRFGENARVLALDLSAAGLAYGARMAEHLGIANIRFVQGDILDVGQFGTKFAVIETMGVLHHMADPAAGWRVLVEQLKPGGLLFAGLYSALSRAPLAALRTEKDYPGPGCSNDTARAYRQALIEADPPVPGGRLVRSKDFFTLSNFRDLVLHESEIHLTLPEIARLIEETGLTFHGFTHEPQVLAGYKKRFPGDTLPGTLENWRIYEEETPGLFNAMYRFWCQKAT